jgi:hypothetical protein
LQGTLVFDQWKLIESRKIYFVCYKVEKSYIYKNLKSWKLKHMGASREDDVNLLNFLIWPCNLIFINYIKIDIGYN